MNLRLLSVVVLMFSASATSAFEPHLSAGLDVVIDRIPEPLMVDGVQLVMHLASGAGVPELARRIEAQWRRHGSDIQSMQQGSWTLRSRIQGAASEVVQWRTGPSGHELVWSSLDAAANVRPVAESGLILPACCKWGRSVSGRSSQGHFLQRSARCTLPAQELSSLLQGSLPSQGWQLLTVSERGLLLERAGKEGLISLSVQAGDRATWLTWLRVEHNP
jgi:hypothetical protein